MQLIDIETRQKIQRICPDRGGFGGQDIRLGTEGPERARGQVSSPRESNL